MANGPVFGIRQSPVINTQVIQIIASAARQFSANVRARKRMEQEQKQFQERQQDTAANLDLREKNLKLQEDRLQFEKEREGRIEEERKSKQEAREGRTAQREQAARDRTTRTRISFFRALSSENQRTIREANKRLNDQVTNLPLVTDTDTQQELIEFEGQTMSQIARTISVRERALASIDEIDRELNPEKVTVLERQLQSGRDALEIRKSQFAGLVESQGHTISNDSAVLNNLLNGLEDQIATDLGLDLGDITPPEAPARDAINEASAKEPTPAQPKETAEQPEIETGGQLQATVANRLIEAATAKEPNDNELNSLRLEARKLSPDEQITVFRQVEAAVGTERAKVIVFGRANP